MEFADVTNLNRKSGERSGGTCGSLHPSDSLLDGDRNRRDGRHANDHVRKPLVSLDESATIQSWNYPAVRFVIALWRAATRALMA